LSRGQSSTGKSSSGEAAAEPIRVGPEYTARYAAHAARATECVLNAVRLGELYMTAIGRVWADHGLSASAGNVLMILTGAGEALPPHVIGQRMLVTRGAVTGLLDALEKRGYARRTPHPRDRRMLLAEVTPAGRELAQLVQPRIVRLELQWVGCLSAAEQAAFITLCGRLQAGVRTGEGS
jgi:DNA-binding MarR family transcriptional regulator